MRLDVRLIATVGKHGQIGLRGALPWAATPDHAKLAESTAGGILLMGWTTAARIDGRKLVTNDRVLALVSHSGLTLIDPKAGPVNRPGEHLARPDQTLREVARYFPGRTIWVAGGERIFDAFAPLCDRFDITIADYDGPADCYMPFLPWAEAS